MNQHATIIAVRKDILSFNNIWFNLSRDQQKEIYECWECCEGRGKPSGFIAERISPGWTLIHEGDAEDLINFEDWSQFNEEEQKFPNFARLVMIKMWWAKLKPKLVPTPTLCNGTLERYFHHLIFNNNHACNLAR